MLSIDENMQHEIWALEKIQEASSKMEGTINDIWLRKKHIKLHKQYILNYA